MASDTFGFLTDQSTLLAVILGAILATIGGFVATAMERYLDRREKEQNAALFFGEILSSLAIIIRDRSDLSAAYQAKIADGMATRKLMNEKISPA